MANAHRLIFFACGAGGDSGKYSMRKLMLFSNKLRHMNTEFELLLGTIQMFCDSPNTAANIEKYQNERKLGSASGCGYKRQRTYHHNRQHEVIPIQLVTANSLAAETHGHISSAGCEGMATTVTAAHHSILRHLNDSMHAAQKPQSKLKFVTLDRESNMSTLWRQEEFLRICSKEELAEKAQDMEVTIPVK